MRKQLLLQFKVLRHLEDLPGLVVGGRKVNNTRYADDTVLLACGKDDLQRLLDKVVAIGTKNGPKTNVKKTKSTLLSREPERMPSLSLRVGNKVVEQVTNLCSWCSYYQ